MAAVSEPIRPQRVPPGPIRELAFADFVRFFHRHWRLIFGAAVLAGLVPGLVLPAVQGRSYGASATLVIVPSKFSSALIPQALSVQSYQQILQSDAVVAEAKKRLVQGGVLAADDALRMDKELEARIFVSRLKEETALAPMLQAVARGKTGEHAAAIANTWAGVFLERIHGLVTGSTSSTVRFIDEQFPQVRDSLAWLENSRVTEANALQRRLDDAADRWGDRITAFKDETASLNAAFQAETRRMIEEFVSRHEVESRRTQLAALRNTYGELQVEQTRVTTLLQLKQLQLAALRKQLADAPPTVTLQKTISDNSSGRPAADGKSGRGGWEAPQGQSLKTYEVNPVYTSLSQKVAEIEISVTPLVPRAASLVTDLERINAGMKVLESHIRKDQADLEKVSRGREAGLQRLAEERENGLADLVRNRGAEIDSIRREMDTRLGQMDRQIEQQRELFAQLARNYNQGLLAKGDQGMEDVRLGAPAVPPDQPEPQHRAATSLLAAILGGMLAFGAALVREAWK